MRRFQLKLALLLVTFSAPFPRLRIDQMFTAGVGILIIAAILWLACKVEEHFA